MTRGQEDREEEGPVSSGGERGWKDHLINKVKKVRRHVGRMDRSLSECYLQFSLLISWGSEHPSSQVLWVFSLTLELHERIIQGKVNCIIRVLDATPLQSLFNRCPNIRCSIERVGWISSLQRGSVNNIGWRSNLNSFLFNPSVQSPLGHFASKSSWSQSITLEWF